MPSAPSAGPGSRRYRESLVLRLWLERAGRATMPRRARDACYAAEHAAAQDQ